MAEFSGKVVTAEFIDVDYTLIKVLYDNEGKLEVFNLSVDPDHQDYKDLIAEGWDTDRIIEDTAESKRMQAAAYNSEINRAARSLAEEMIGMKELQEQKSTLKFEVDKAKSTIDKAKMTAKQLEEYNEQAARAGKKIYSISGFDGLLENNSDKDSLFKAKLWALELDIVKEQDKEFKSKVRKAKRTTQLFGLLDSILG